MTGQADQSVQLIAEAAAAFGVEIVDRSGATVLFDVPIPRLDGRPATYRIEAVAIGTSISVKEHSPIRLPTCCPNLHINPDSTFCLSLKSEDQLSVIDAPSAASWWETLIQFLRLQERAARLRRWPDTREWAHGEAAGYQKKAYEAAEHLGPEFALALREQRLDIVAVPTHGPASGEMLRLMLEDQHLISVRSPDMTVVNRRKLCPCAHERRRVLLRHCTQHEQAIITLVAALHDWRKAENEFWAQLSEWQCCGRLEKCGLRAKELL